MGMGEEVFPQVTENLEAILPVRFHFYFLFKFLCKSCRGSIVLLRLLILQ